MAFTGPLQDRLLIRERMGAYADAAFRGDREAWLANWIDDCVWFSLGQEHRGKAAMRDQWAVIWANMERMGFFTEIGAIEVDGDRASARCYCREILVMKDGSVPKLIGAYEDELVRRGEDWLFASRRYTVLLAEPGQPAG